MKLVVYTKWLCVGALALELPSRGPVARTTTRRAVQMSATKDSMVASEISANNLKMTDSMRDYVTEKIGAVVDRYAPLVTRCDTHLSVLRNPSVSESDSCECVVFAGDHVVRAEERTGSMYSSIDLVASKLSRKLRKLKEKREASMRGDNKELREAIFETPLEVDDASNEPQLSEIVRSKKFPMPLQSLEEAKTCLDWLDHDFYMFKSAETGEISVLYKRLEGGLGLIEPDN